MIVLIDMKLILVCVTSKWCLWFSIPHLHQDRNLQRSQAWKCLGKYNKMYCLCNQPMELLNLALSWETVSTNCSCNFLDIQYFKVLQKQLLFGYLTALIISSTRVRWLMGFCSAPGLVTIFKPKNLKKFPTSKFIDMKVTTRALSVLNSAWNSLWVVR